MTREGLWDEWMQVCESESCVDGEKIRFFSLDCYDRPSFSSWPHLEVFFFATRTKCFCLRARGFFWLSRKVNPKVFDPISLAISSNQCSIGCTFYLSRPFGNQVSLPRNFFSTFSTYLVSRQSYIRQKKLHTWPKFTQHTANNALFEGRERRKKKDNRRRRSNKWNLTSCQRLWPQLEFFRFSSLFFTDKSII